MKTFTVVMLIFVFAGVAIFLSAYLREQRKADMYFINTVFHEHWNGSEGDIVAAWTQTVAYLKHSNQHPRIVRLAQKQLYQAYAELQENESEA